MSINHFVSAYISADIIQKMKLAEHHAGIYDSLHGTKKKYLYRTETTWCQWLNAEYSTVYFRPSKKH